MIEAKGNEIYRAGVKIGWVEGNHVCDRTGKRLGYFTTNEVYDIRGEKMARVEGDYVYFGGKQVELVQIIHNIAAVGLSDTARVAIITFLGE